MPVTGDDDDNDDPFLQMLLSSFLHDAEISIHRRHEQSDIGPPWIRCREIWAVNSHYTFNIQIPKSEDPNVGKARLSAT